MSPPTRSLMLLFIVLRVVFPIGCFALSACHARSGSATSVVAAPSPASAPSPVRIVFDGIAPEFAAARAQYEQLWRRDGERIITAMERVSGLRFDSLRYADTLIHVVVFEGVSNSGYREQPVRLRASYPEETKRATIVHELGHRLLADIDPNGEDAHAILFLWLYDAWVELWGAEFADRQVAVERARGGPYPAAWDRALGLTREGRAARWRTYRGRRPAAR